MDRIPIHGKYYDLRRFNHPGGKEILELCKDEPDCSALFESYHIFTDMNRIKLIMKKYFIFIPNLLSIFRIFLMYPLLTFISQENYLFALYIFILAVITDALDGYLARFMDWRTDLGKILDPIADKVLLIGTI